MILFDDTPSKDFNWYKFRDVVSYVSQDVFLFSDTIRNNILFGANDVSNLELLNIIQELCLFEEINAFTDKIDTHIGEGGITLSGGQKQRISLARALVRKPKFLFLDDALSSVDSVTEIKIMNYIQSNFKNTTVILTSNRLSVLRFCSKIFVLKSGVLIQEGVNNKLIKINGEYKKTNKNSLIYEFLKRLNIINDKKFSFVLLSKKNNVNLPKIKISKPSLRKG